MVIIGTVITAQFVFGIPFLMLRLKDKINIWLLLVSYVAVIVFLTLGNRPYNDNVTINLKLFLCFRRIWFQLSNSFRRYGHKYDLQQLWRMRRGICNIILNVIIFAPVGYLVPSAFKGIDRWKKILLIGFGFSLAIEVMQLITHRGWFDADDLLLNTVGALIGWMLFLRVLVQEK